MDHGVLVSASAIPCDHTPPCQVALPGDGTPLGLVVSRYFGPGKGGWARGLDPPTPNDSLSRGVHALPEPRPPPPHRWCPHHNRRAARRHTVRQRRGGRLAGQRRRGGRRCRAWRGDYLLLIEFCDRYPGVPDGLLWEATGGGKRTWAGRGQGAGSVAPPPSGRSWRRGSACGPAQCRGLLRCSRGVTRRRETAELAPKGSCRLLARVWTIPDWPASAGPPASPLGERNGRGRARDACGTRPFLQIAIAWDASAAVSPSADGGAAATGAAAGGWGALHTRSGEVLLFVCLLLLRLRPPRTAALPPVVLPGASPCPCTSSVRAPPFPPPPPPVRCLTLQPLAVPPPPNRERRKPWCGSHHRSRVKRRRRNDGGLEFTSYPWPSAARP
eukprot:gene22345-biopygen23718